MHNPLLTTDNVSKILHVGKSTVKRWTEEGKLKCFRTPGGHRKFKVESVQEFIRNYEYDVSISYQPQPAAEFSNNATAENVVVEPMLVSPVEVQ